MERERLDKFLASQLNKSRKEVKTAIHRGTVTVNGQTAQDPGQWIEPGEDAVTFEGQAVFYRKFLYLLMNKPKGVLSACEDRHANTVLDLVPESMRRKGLFPVGRLDKDTTGLLLLTDDGDFAHRLLSPKNEIYKIYIARLDGEVPPAAVAAFAQGVTLADGTVCRKAFLEPLPGCRAQVRICEGRFHQIKRMFGTVGLGVEELQRIAVGDLRLPDDLREGECIELERVAPRFVEKVKSGVNFFAYRQLN